MALGQGPESRDRTGVRSTLGKAAGPLLVALIAAGCVPDAGAAPPSSVAPSAVPASAMTARVVVGSASTGPASAPASSGAAPSAVPASSTTTTAPVVVGSPSTSATPSNAPLPNFGAQFHATWSDYTDAQRLLVLDRLAAAGATWVRIDVGWRTLEPDRQGTVASWYLRLVEFSVDQARSRGLSVLLTVLDTPAWASGSSDPTVPPRDAGDYGRVMGWLASHFKGRVAAYEVWNEPDLGAFFSGSASEYVALLKTADVAIHSADSAAIVVGGGTEQNDTDYLGAVYAAGGHGSFDVWATHPYMGPSDAPPELADDGNPWRIDHVKAIHALMVAHGDGDKAIWFTEFGWSSHATAPDAPSWKRGVSEAQQADYLVRALRFIGSSYPYVTNVFWYNERDGATGDAQTDNYGLMTRDFQPKPVYAAVRGLLG